ncbi:hypothetical protein HMPREF0322_02897 [Desulfitobacterium hafniense DP7]|uniref:Uncharacterized protein n=1 Tax=Desulfitobacterium hafniense DP7 TaxID=537010 RepID=G9XPK1_DESHA|nr:hypothetical protein HMPREF0322_02897 [Desulfitobacterium hafniense DP7]
MVTFWAEGKGKPPVRKLQELSGKTYLTYGAIFIRWCPKVQRAAPLVREVFLLLSYFL